MSGGGQGRPDIQFKPGGWREEDSHSDHSEGQSPWPNGSYGSSRAGSRRRSEAAVEGTTPSPQLARVLLDETTRRHDRRTMAVLEKSIEKYDQRLRYTYFSNRTDLLQSETLFGLSGQDSLDSLKAEPFYWIDVNGFTEADLVMLAETFGIHPLTIEDIQMQDNREKCEVFEQYVFICIRTLDQTPDVLGPTGAKWSFHQPEPVNVYMIIFQSHILTIHREPIQTTRNVLKRIYPLRNLFELSSDWIGYSFIDDVVDEFMPGLRKIEFEVDSIDDLVLVLSQSDQAEMLRRIGKARKRVTHLMRLLKPKTDVVKALSKRCPERLKQHTLLYLRDSQDHLLTMVQNLDHYSETLNRSHNNYLAQISIELNAASNRMDSVVKKLTGAAFFMLPLSLISSIWGMNIPVPGDGRFTEDFLPFFIILTGMGTLALIMYFIARKYDWL